MKTRTTLIIVVFLILSSSLSCVSQTPAPPPDGWEVFDLDQYSGLRTDAEELNSALFFNSPRSGYLYTDAAGYVTMDGGRTWNEGSYIHFKKILPGGFGLNGWFVTEDSGATWRHLDVEPINLLVGGGVGADADAAFSSRNHYSIRLIQSYEYYDSVQQKARASAILRVVYTSDGGAKWRSADTIQFVPDPNGVAPVVSPKARFGVFPRPSSFDPVEVGWKQMVAMPDSNTLVAVSYAREKTDSTNKYRYYLGTFDLSGNNATWVELPFWQTLNVYSLDHSSTDLRMPAPGVFYALDLRRSSTLGVFAKGFLRSIDSGRTWDSIAVPLWIDPKEVRFFSATHGVAPNGYTNDGGETWTRDAFPFQAWRSPIESGPFYAIDSLNYVLANNYSFFARSSDAGDSWIINGHGSPAQSIVASGGVVLVGREFHSLLISRDYGSTWQDVGRSGGLPAKLNVVFSAAFPDTTNRDRIVGVAGFYGRDGYRWTAIISSTDGGFIWQEGERLPQVYYRTVDIAFPKSADGSSPYGVIRADGQIITSEDAGASWTLRQNFWMAQSAMLDSAYGIAVRVDTGGGGWGVVRTTDCWRSVQSIENDPEGYSFPVGVEIKSREEFQFVVIEPEIGSRMPVKLYRTTDAGESWESVQLGTVSKTTSGRFYWLNSTHAHLVTESHTYELRGIDSSLVDVTDSLPVGVFGSDNRYLYHVSPGNRASRLPLTPSTGSAPITPSNSRAQLRVARNGNLITATVELNRAGDVSLDIVSATGQVVFRSAPELGSIGILRRQFDISDLPTGIYWVRMIADGVVTSTPVSLVR